MHLVCVACGYGVGSAATIAVQGKGCRAVAPSSPLPPCRSASKRHDDALVSGTSCRAQRTILSLHPALWWLNLQASKFLSPNDVLIRTLFRTSAGACPTNTTSAVVHKTNSGVDAHYAERVISQDHAANMAP